MKRFSIVLYTAFLFMGISSLKADALSLENEQNCMCYDAMTLTPCSPLIREVKQSEFYYHPLAKSPKFL